MSFRARLRLFFLLLVIVPMIALAIVLFALTSRSETGKADAGIATAVRTGFALYEQAARRADPVLPRLASDPGLRAALASRRGVEARLRTLLGGPDGVVLIELRSPRGRLIARAGSPNAVAPSTAPLAVGGRAIGTLSVSTTPAKRFAAEVRGLTGFHVALFRAGRSVGATRPGLADRDPLGSRGEPRTLELSGTEFRGRVDAIRESSGAPVELAVLQPSSELSENVAQNRLLIGAVLVAFLLLAAVAAAIVSRALTGQIAKFLEGARRLARGDFTHPIPAEGRDEFAELGREFNSMSVQLEAKIEEVERKRAELAETIRRVGDALATGLDRDGVVALAVRTAVDACEADAGRALPLERDGFKESRSGRLDDDLVEAIAAAERRAFEVRPEVGPELLEPIDGDAHPARRRRTAPGRVGNAHALAVPMRGLLDPPAPEYLGALSIARRGRPFTREEEELLEYLAGQAVVSIENASLHATVERQAVTDELTGLANVRAFGSILEREIERARRFDGSLALIMVDLDRFKQVNDEHGHQQGDEVLAAVAAVLRELSRDIDAPARYGGEELAVVLPGTDSDGAALLAERMRERIESLRVPHVDGRDPLRVTASFGVAALPENGWDRESLIAAADAALYRAKRAGRNRVERAETVAAAG